MQTDRKAEWAERENKIYKEPQAGNQAWVASSTISLYGDTNEATGANNKLNEITHFQSNRNINNQLSTLKN